MRVEIVLTLLSFCTLIDAFFQALVPHGVIRTELFLNSKNKEKTTIPDPQPKKSFSAGDLIQLIMMGAGAPSLGEYKRTDENGKMIFELEANNFLDKDGSLRQTKGKYFTDGYVEESDLNGKPPGFWANLLSGGKLQSDWDAKNGR